MITPSNYHPSPATLIVIVLRIGYTALTFNREEVCEIILLDEGRNKVGEIESDIAQKKSVEIDG